MDTARNRKFFEAIQKAITDLKQQKKEVHLVYAGSGTGILGIFALACGADTAVFLEHNPYSLELSKKLVQKFGYSSQVRFIECDATTVQLDRKYDLLLSETITSGFVNEEFPQIINHLKQFGNKGSIILPQKFEVELQEKDVTNVILNTQRISFVSQDGLESQKITLKNANTTHITWKTTATLYGPVQVSSGDTMSFLNEMTREVQGISHQLFDIS